MSSDPKPVGGQWHKAARGELSPPKGASEETLVPQLFTASVPDPRTVQQLTNTGLCFERCVLLPVRLASASRSMATRATT